MLRKMADINFPLTEKGFYTVNQLSQNADLMDRLKREVGNLITTSANLVGLEASMMAGLIFVESPQNIDNGVYIGYCQIDVITAISALWREFKQGRATTAEENYLTSLIGANAVRIIKTAKSDVLAVQAKPFDSSVLKRADVNIFIGAVYFKQCVDKEHVLGQLARFDKAVIRYNAGYFINIPNSANADTLLAVPKTLWKAANPNVKFLTDSKIDIMRNYVLKMFGSTSPMLYAMKIFA
jgi:hypothetical protein